MQAADSDDTAPSVSFYGIVKDHNDALLLLTAARLGLVPRFRRRLNLAEQDALIYSGSVFLWTEQESCMKRWTDGYPWSPSRIHHEFLLYREMAERGCARTRTSSRLAAAAKEANEESVKPSDDRRRKTIRALAGSLFNDQELESLVALSTSGPPRFDDVFKRGGLMKKTFSLSLPGETWHVVSYYSLEDALTSRLVTPKESELLKELRVPLDIQSYHALSTRRLSLGNSGQNRKETSPHDNTSSQDSHPRARSPDILAAVAGSTDADEWFNILSTPIETPTPCLPLPLPSYTTSRSGEDRRHIVPDNLTAATWYNFT